MSLCDWGQNSAISPLEQHGHTHAIDPSPFSPSYNRGGFTQVGFFHQPKEKEKNKTRNKQREGKPRDCTRKSKRGFVLTWLALIRLITLVLIFQSRCLIQYRSSVLLCGPLLLCNLAVFCEDILVLLRMEYHFPVIIAICESSCSVTAGHMTAIVHPKHGAASACFGPGMQEQLARLEWKTDSLK